MRTSAAHGSAYTAEARDRFDPVLEQLNFDRGPPMVDPGDVSQRRQLPFHNGASGIGSVPSR
jgi:hypothetical protein